jgi:hypothetical protein
MRRTKEEATAAAKHDLAARLGVDEGGIEELSIIDREFPDMSLGAPADDEMSAQMISSGWVIRLGANGCDYEYRADKYQLRLVGFDGQNYVIQ